MKALFAFGFVIGSAVTLFGCKAQGPKESLGGNNSGAGRVWRASNFESYESKVGRFDGQMAANEFLVPVTITRTITDTTWTHTARLAMRAGQSARIGLPEGAQCIAGQGQWNQSGSISGTFNSQNCSTQISVATGTQPNGSGVFGTAIFTGPIRHDNRQKSMNYSVEVVDASRFTGLNNDPNNLLGPTNINGIPVERRFIDVGALINSAAAAGQIQMYSVSPDTPNGTAINHLVFPIEAMQAVLLREFELARLNGPNDAGYQYEPVSATNPQVKCSIAHQQELNGPLTTVNVLPARPEDDPDNAGSSTPIACPFVRRSLTLTNEIGSGGTVIRERYSGEVDIEVQTDTLPATQAHPVRHTVKYLGHYGGFLPGPRNYLVYELLMLARNPNRPAGEQLKYVASTYFINLNIIDLTRSNDLSAYQFVGSFEGSDYYVLKTKMPFSRVREQAQLLKGFLVAHDAYAVDIGNLAEFNFLMGATAAFPSRLWIGLDDIVQEGSYRWHSGRTFSMSEIQPFSAGFNNDGNEDCIHKKFNPQGHLNDTECYRSYEVIVEVKQNGPAIPFR